MSLSLKFNFPIFTKITVLSVEQARSNGRPAHTHHQLNNFQPGPVDLAGLVDCDMFDDTP